MELDLAGTKVIAWALLSAGNICKPYIAWFCTILINLIVYLILPYYYDKIKSVKYIRFQFPFTVIVLNSLTD